MAPIPNSSISIAVDGLLDWTGGAANHTVLELDEWIQGLADDQQASGDDFMDITIDNPSDQSTTKIIELKDYSSVGGPTFRVTEALAEHLFDGSIKQNDGDELFAALEVKGSVNNTATQLMIIQDNDLYQFTTDPQAPFWGDQSTGGFNGDAAAGVLLRCLVKVRTNGADIDGKRIRVQARHWGDTYDFFNVTMGEGVSVAAIGTTPDPQNDTLQATVTAYTHVTNSGGTVTDPTGGYQLIDLNNGSGPSAYYSQWTYGADTAGDQIKSIWEFGKDLSGRGSTRTIDGLNGELFLGISHSFDYDGEVGNFQEREVVAWGTSIDYDAESANFTLGEYVTIGSNGAAGKIVHITDAGTTGVLLIALEDTSITILDNDVITGITSGSTANVDTNIVDNDKQGGTGLLLALDDQGTTGEMWIQLLTGSAPIDNLSITGQTSNSLAILNGAPTAQTLSKVYLGSYTGNMTGPAFGVGFAATDLTNSDSVIGLDGTTQTPPNNQTFNVSGLVVGEDYVLAGPRAGNGTLNKAQFTVATTALTTASTQVEQNTAIPGDTPSSGTIRVFDDGGYSVYTEYNSYSGSIYQINGTYSSAAAIGNNLYITYIDKLATATTEGFSYIYQGSDIDLLVRARDGGTTPIDPFEAPAQATATGGSIAVIRTTR